MAGKRDKGKARGKDPGKKKAKKVPAVATGEALKQEGIRRATEHNPAEVLALQLGLLGAIHEHGTATVDTGEDRTQIRTRFGHLGLRGAAVSGLVATKVIKSTGRRVKSQRPFRHNTENREWQATDPAALPVIISRMECRLADLLGNGGAK